jgi:signal peptidase I
LDQASATPPFSPDVPAVPEPPRPPSRRSGRKLVFWLLAISFALVGTILTLRFALPSALGIRLFYMPSESMEPTLMGHAAGETIIGQPHTDEIHDRFLVNTRAYQTQPPQIGDIIVFRAPPQADISAGEHGQPQQEYEVVKRIVAVGGQEIQIKTDNMGVIRVFVNRTPLDESYIHFLEPMQDVSASAASLPIPGTPFASYLPLKLKPDEVFVLGDNRNHSNDSRFWGPLKVNRIIGKATSIVAPAHRVQELR